MGRVVGLTFKKEHAEKFVCEVCGAEFKTDKELKAHIKKEHAENNK